MKNLIIIALLFTGVTVKATAKNNLILIDTTEVVQNNVLHKVTSDNNYIYLNVSTTDKKTSMSIIRNGLTVYFDIKGKENKDVYIKYPYNNDLRDFRQRPQEQNENNEFSSIDLNEIIENIPGEAEFGYFDEIQQFHKDLNSLDISLNFKTNEELLEFSLKIPKNTITDESKTDFSKLSIGVMTNKFEKNKREGQNQGFTRGGGNSSGSGMGRGRGKMNKGNGGKRANQQAIDKIEIDFWFDANLK